MTEVIEDHASKFQRFFIFNSSWGPTEDTGIIIYVSVKILKEISTTKEIIDLDFSALKSFDDKVMLNLSDYEMITITYMYRQILI